MAISYFGSFQDGHAVPSEDPLETTWSYINRAASTDFLYNYCKPGSSSISYAAVRLRQAVEFRNSSRATTLLTKPLLLYYSALNLFRAGIAVATGAHPTPAHGLRHVKSKDLLGHRATATNGTFRDLLSSLGSAASPSSLSLDDCLSMIPELGDVYSAVTGRPTRAIPVHVHYSRVLHLTFDEHFISRTDFLANWEIFFPKLAQLCYLPSSCEEDDLSLPGSGETCRLIVRRSVNTSSYEAIAKFCSDHLENRLFYGSEPIWYALRETPNEPLLPRAAYYFAALFILSSIVRYQPDVLSAPETLSSQPAWLIDRFLSAAERALPQLVYNWISSTQTYFGSIG